MDPVRIPCVLCAYSVRSFYAFCVRILWVLSAHSVGSICAFCMRILYVLSVRSVRSICAFCTFLLRILCVLCAHSGYAYVIQLFNSNSKSLYTDIVRQASSRNPPYKFGGPFPGPAAQMKISIGRLASTVRRILVRALIAPQLTSTT